MERRPPNYEESKCEDRDVAAPPEYPRLAGVQFPSKIQALPHVLRLLDTLLMTPEEALMEAVSAHQVQWVEELVERFVCDVTEAFVQAATQGYCDVVELLSGEIWGTDAKVFAPKGAVAAAANGHVDVVGFLFLWIVELFDCEREPFTWFPKAQAIMDAAARNGHVEVVKFMIQHAIENRYNRGYSIWRVDDSLSMAIAGKHVEVADILMNHSEMVWNQPKAFELAVRTEQKAIAAMICELNPQQYYGKSLFAVLAERGYRNAVEYVYNTGHVTDAQVDAAFDSAAAAGELEVLAFLHGTDRVSSDVFDEAFKQACDGHRNILATVEFLYGLKRASPQGINRGFAAADSVGVLEFLSKSEPISEEAIIAAFKTSTHRNTASIAKLLHTQQCIPSDVIDTAVVQAAKEGHQEILECLINDERVSAKARGLAFVAAATAGEEDLVKLLYETKRAPPDVLLKGFIEAAHHRRSGTLRLIAEYLSDEKHVPREFKDKAFVAAAQHGYIHGDLA